MVKTFDEAYELLKPYPSDFFMSIMLAQWALESDYGRSELALMANNFTGHKTTGWTGEVYRKDTIEDDGTGKKFVAKSEPFRKYESPQEWAKHHAGWLQRLPDTYAKAINAKTVEVQAQALQGTYATDTAYAKKLMGMIKANNLTRFDKKESVQMTFPKPAMTDRHKHALGYPGHGAYARRSKSAIKNIVWHYTAVKRSLNRKIWDHEGYWKNTHKWDIGGYHYYIDSDGKIYWNYDLEIATYGASAANPYTMHISVEANSASDYSQAQIKAREDLTLWLLTNDLKHLTGQSMRGHKEVPGNSTSCPGYSVAQLNQFRAVLDRKLKAGTPNEPANNDFDLPAYQAPAQAFKTLKVGNKVTIREGQTYWYIPDGKGRKPSKDFAGDTDTITKVMDVSVGYSKRAYLLKDKVSWVLEQDLVEPRSDWSSEQKDQQEKLDYVYIDGVKRAIGDVIK